MLIFLTFCGKGGVTRQFKSKGGGQESKKENYITSKVSQIFKNPTRFKKFKKIKKKGRSNQEVQDSSKDYQEESKMCQEPIKKGFFIYLKKK